MDFNILCTNEKRNKYSILRFTYVVVLIGYDIIIASHRASWMFTDELQQRQLTVWNELEQQIIDNAVDQWRDRLAACVREEGGHFEHTL